MKAPFFSFRYHLSSRLGAPQWLVAFTADPELDVPEFWKMLEEGIGRDLWPSALVLIVRENVAEAFSTEIRHLLGKTADWRAGLNRSPIAVVGFDAFGRFAVAYECSDAASVRVDPDRFDALLAQGLRTLFLRRDGLLIAPPSSHFIYPSGKHGDAFMRIANLLLYGPEISFIALGLLRHLRPDVRFVLLDTSSIASIAFAAVVLRVQLDPSFRPPIIGSFSSWSSLQGYDFPTTERLIVVISASTSGKMARTIRDTKGVPESQIATLFSLAEDRSGTEIVCDLAADIGAPPEWDVQRYAEFPSTETCALCRSGSKPITFVGDQFLADAVTYEPIEVHQKDAPEHLARQMEAYYGRGAFFMKNSGAGAAVDEFFVDIPKIMAESRFGEALRATIARHAPASTSLLVSPGDSDSVALATQVQEMVKAYTGKAPPLLRPQDLVSDPPVLAENQSIMIVSGAIETGSQIQSIDRGLRDPYGSRPRLFLIGLIKHTNSPATAHVLKDLEFSGTRHRHGVVKIEEMVLPERPGVSAWAAEWNMLSRVVDPFVEPPPECDEEALEVFRTRKDEIDSLADGAVDGFFWKSPKSLPLKLRKTFAFWPFDYEADRATQGDVLITIASVLQNVREGKRPRMWQSAFHQSVISPTMFSRYNDGIVQAALLRCALPHEIDYRGDAGLSRDMGYLLGGFVASSGDEAGEASYEFLVAIASGRLKLRDEDVERALSTVNCDLSPMSALASLRRH